MRLDKVKRPAGIFSFQVQQLTCDDFGTWLHAPAGSPWHAPHDSGRLPHGTVFLVNPQHWVVGWWNDDPENRYVAVDVCLPPERTGDGWSFVDLELDVVCHSSGVVEIEDEDEFEAACRNGWISAAEAEVALTTATAIADMLRDRVEPWADAGWDRLSGTR